MLRFFLFASSIFSLVADRVLVLVPGFGFNPRRTDIVIRSLKNIISSDVPYFCVVFSYENNLDKVNKNRGTPQEHRNFIHETCEVIDYLYANYAAFMKSVPVIFLRQSGYSHVFVLLDDVELHSFDLKEILDIMTRNELSMISPLVGII